MTFFNFFNITLFSHLFVPDTKYPICGSGRIEPGVSMQKNLPSLLKTSLVKMFLYSKLMM